VKIHLNRFLRRVRIHGGEFDTSARAMYRDEVVYPLQAEPRIVRGSTIERKQMSTKTTFKRLALVTVAALGLGVLSVAPSSAAVQADTMTLSASTASTTVGTAVTVNVTTTFLQDTTSDSMTVSLSYVAAPAGISISPSEVDFSSISTVATDLGSPVVDTSTVRVAKISTTTAASVNKTLTVKLTPSKSGTYVIKFTPAHLPSGTPVATAQTWTVTVAAKTVGKSSAFLKGAGTFPVVDTATADATVAVSSAANTSALARIDVASIYGTTGNETASAADAPSVVVATDKGLVSKTSVFTDGAKSVTTAAAVDADPSYWVFANGEVGKASITITVGGVLLATKTVTFTGPATALVATKGTAGTDLSFIAVGTSNSTVVITATDSAGGAATALPTTMTVTSSDTSVATATIVSGTVTITGVKVGTATLTIKDSATTAPAASATYAVTVKAVRPTTAPTITFDKSAYNVGEVITMTVNADMADSATASNLFTTALVTSAGLTAVAGTTPLSTSSAAHAIASGKATYKFYAPAVSGSFTVTGTTGGTVDITTAVAVSTTVDITNPGVDAATVAAEAAEAAAQDATDAALDATTAAEAAGALAQEAVDLVTELSAEVTKLIAGVRASITYLTKLVMKLAAKK
jgi:trimeric autotransporter adhesin